ncbi:MAG: MlaD family protein [Treponema sp.]|jgi:phospholipid/cholesterol/gamma-HCH transport system substrate-binding protein|nr:MlaD family protein [Treponema sp.]
MKFTIRFADQLVGGLIILALAALIFVIFMLGSNQRWFSRDYQFQTYFSSASGLSQNMPVQYKGFTIGRVKSIALSENDEVEVYFTIFDTYIDRVRLGSLVEVLVSPINMGNQFMFYPGNGIDLVQEGTVIPSVNSVEGKELMDRGLAVRPERDDSINNIMNRTGTVLATLNDTLFEVQEAFVGTDRTRLGRTLGEVELAVRGLRVMSEKLPEDVEVTMDRIIVTLDSTVTVLNDTLFEVQEALEGTDRTSLGRTLGEVESAARGLRVLAEQLPDDLGVSIDTIMAQIDPILENLNQLSAGIVDPDGTIMSILDSEGDLYTELIASLSAISGILKNLETTTDFIPAQLPQITLLLANLQATLKSAQDVLIALTNNPLLKGGIPQRQETRPDGLRPRDVEF